MYKALDVREYNMIVPGDYFEVESGEDCPHVSVAM